MSAGVVTALSSFLIQYTPTEGFAHTYPSASRFPVTNGIPYFN